MISNSHESSGSSQISRMAFGIGSWDFGIRCDLTSRFTIAQYVNLLTHALESIPSLNNLEIVPEPDDHGDRVIDANCGTSTPNGLHIFSHGSLYSISFDLYIPFRIQIELGGPFVESDTNTEHFKVHTRYDYYSPVVFVELVGGDKPSVPSSAVMVIRDYLEFECERSSHNLLFSCVGPTPFHANFYIESHPDSHVSDIFNCEDLRLRGYSKITFTYCVLSFGTMQDAFEDLMEELADELGVYYKVQRDDFRRYRQWHNISTLLTHLTDHFDQTGWRKILWLTFTRGNDLNKLSVALARFEANRVSTEHSIAQAFRSTYSKRGGHFLKEYVEENIENRPIFPQDPTMDLVAFIEGRRIKALEFIVTLSAAIVGGIIGSLITLMLQ